MSLSLMLLKMARKDDSAHGKLMSELAGMARQLENRIALLQSNGVRCAEDMDYAASFINAPRGRTMEERAANMFQLCHNGNVGATPFEDVRAFSSKFFRPWPDRPVEPPVSVTDLRSRLIEEEANELAMAMDDGNLPSIAGEAVDLLYVTYGVFVDYGIRPEPFWAAIHKANMEKIPGAPGEKVRKPDGWQKANLVEILEEQL